MRFDDQVVVVTGAGRGLGRLYALDFAERGATVVVNDLGAGVDGAGSDSDVADRVVNQIRTAGGRASASYESVTSAEGGTRIIDGALGKFGRLDALVNNAGNIVPAPFGEVGDVELSALLDVHVRGAFNTTQPAFRAMRDQGYGRIVFTSSSAGAFGSPGLAAYAAAKAAILGLARVVALEGEPHGVLVNSVLPTGRTRMGGASPVVYERDAPTITPARRAFLDSMRPEFVRPLVVFLASRDCAITGHVFSAAGRRYARSFTGLTRGWVSSELEPSAEGIRDHLGEISDTSAYDVPDSVATEINGVMTRLEQELGSMEI
ncbi:MAG: SDR family NAD(P)-dependent oxidoreductase [Candidatus Dormibacteria bacterium]